MGNLVEKKQIVAELREKFEKASGYFFIDFEKMNVAEINNLRRLFVEKQVEYRVAKNTLIEIALEEIGMKFYDRSFIQGSTGIAFSYGDPLTPAKVLKPILDKSEKPKFKAAIVEGVFYGPDQLKTLASLPTKAELIAGILGSLNAPISGIVGSINAVMRDLASVIEESAKKRSA